MSFKPVRISSPVIVLVGPTAIGKTSLSIDLAHRFNCEIISMDSMQVYRYMDIGTAKVTRKERGGVEHYLIDIRNPDEQYDAAMFVADTLCAIDKINRKGKIPLITGGTGLYLSSLVNGLFEGVAIHPNIRNKVNALLSTKGRAACYELLKRYDPESSQRIHINDTQRLLRGLEIYLETGIPWSEHLRRQEAQPKKVDFSNLLVIGLDSSRERLYSRIEQRTEIMINSGFIDEVEKLLSMGFGPELTSMQSIGYRQAVKLILGKYDRQRAVEEIKKATRRYAKRQFTWFNKVNALEWYNYKAKEQITRRIQEVIEESMSGKLS